MGLKAITANRLHDGRVVYLDRDGEWVTEIAHANAFPAEREDSMLAHARADEAGCLIVGPYSIELTDTPTPEPATLRERIRARGPTTESANEENGEPAHAYV